MAVAGLLASRLAELTQVGAIRRRRLSVAVIAPTGDCPVGAESADVVRLLGHPAGG